MVGTHVNTRLAPTKAVLACGDIRRLVINIDCFVSDVKWSPGDVTWPSMLVGLHLMSVGSQPAWVGLGLMSAGL